MIKVYCDQESTHFKLSLERPSGCALSPGWCFLDRSYCPGGFVLGQEANEPRFVSGLKDAKNKDW